MPIRRDSVVSWGGGGVVAEIFRGLNGGSSGNFSVASNIRRHSVGGGSILCSVSGSHTTALNGFKRVIILYWTSQSMAWLVPAMSSRKPNMRIDIQKRNMQHPSFSESELELNSPRRIVLCCSVIRS